VRRTEYKRGVDEAERSGQIMPAGLVLAQMIYGGFLVKPKSIIYVDDKKTNIESVFDFCDSSDISYQGILYLDPTDIDAK
jgi:hypothetical protein